MNTRYLALIVHDHQPVGNFDWVFERAYQRAYRPFLELLESFSSVRVGFHHSGILLRWLEARHPSYLESLRAMVERGQVELLTGGFYEPILPSIPEQDRIGQIRMLTDHLRERFGVEPVGLWLAERVWEPELVGTLRRAGVEYTVLDDSHFFAAGSGSEIPNGYVLAENGDETVEVLLIDQTLRRMIPYADPAEVVGRLERIVPPGGLRVFGDDGEKFGMWPKTEERCYGEEWLRRFFDRITGHEHLETVLPSAYRRVHDPAGRVHLPPSSYREMNRWVLPPVDRARLEEADGRSGAKGSVARRDVPRGGRWHGFLERYDEANWMHKRMLWVSRRLDVARAGGGDPGPDAAEARDHLYRAQCNCAYWHGVFGGLYLPHLRAAVYENLIAAEACLERPDGVERVEVVPIDLDGDGRDEIVLRNRHLALFFAPHRGGRLVELDDRARRANLTETLRRTPEAYHVRLGEGPGDDPGRAASIHEVFTSKEAGLAERLVYDSLPHASLLDHVFEGGEDLGAFSRGEGDPRGDFVELPYEWMIDRGPGSAILTMSRTGSFRAEGGQVELEVSKAVTLASGKPEVTIDYALCGDRGRARIDLVLGVEWNVNVQAGDAPDRFYRISGKASSHQPLSSSGSVAGVGTVAVVDEWRGLEVRLAFSEPAELWRYPLVTVSLSEGGFERIHQGCVLLPRWRVRLAGDRPWRMRMRVEVAGL